MNKNKQYDIFISYRRDGGFDTAYAIAQQLRHSGYRVFFDIDTLGSGKFNTQLYNVIENCKDFVVILPKDGLNRCVAEDDWIRLEIAYAIKLDKNIIPIMLREFEFPDSLPADINELRFYQGVAAGDHNFFTAAIEKLKSLLKSKRGFTFDRYKKYIIIGFVLLSIIGAVGCYYWWNERQGYITLCRDTATVMGTQLIPINGALGEINDVYKEWDSYTTKLMQCQDLADTVRLKNDFFSKVNYYKNKHHSMATLTLSEKDKTLFRANKVEVADIEGYFNVALPAFYQEVDRIYKMLLFYASPRYYYANTDVCNTFASQNKIEINISAESVYCYYLGVMATMPKEVYEIVNKFKNDLTNLPIIVAEQPRSVFEDRCIALNNRLAEMVYSSEDVVQQERAVSNRVENILEGAKEKAAEQQIKKEITQAIVSIEEKKANLVSKQGEVAEGNKRLVEAHEQAVKKFAIQADDEQWYAWGKVMRMVTLATNAQTFDKQAMEDYSELVRIAKSQNIDPSFLTKPTSSVSASEMFRNVDRWLNDYLKFYQGKDANASQYVATAKQYFKALEKGSISHRGILMVATENNVPHPVLKIGDIVIERRGKSVNSTDEYFKLKDGYSPNILKIIRFVDNKMQILTETVPVDCKVLVGFVDLKEAE